MAPRSKAAGNQNLISTDNSSGINNGNAAGWSPRPSSGPNIFDSFNQNKGKNVEMAVNGQESSPVMETSGVKRKRGRTKGLKISKKSNVQSAIVTRNRGLQIGNEQEFPVYAVGDSARKANGRSKKKDNEDKKAAENKAKPSLKRPKKNILPANIISWLIENEIIQQKMSVYSIDDGKRSMKDGMIKPEGIHCCCCNKTLTVSGFQSHCGFSPSRPYSKIFIGESNVSLLSCMIMAWQQPVETSRHKFNTKDPRYQSTDSHDASCILCDDGGKLMCCDGCNSTYHHTCIGFKEVPNIWHCPYCICKFCGNLAGKGDNLLSCAQCEKKYHWECHLKRGPLSIDLNEDQSTTFCEKSCRQVYEKLRGMVGQNNVLDSGFSWTLLHRMEDSGVEAKDLYQTAETHAKLAVAWTVIRECFNCKVDKLSRANIMRSVVYNCGSDYKRIDFKNFYTAVLEKNDIIIAVACLRMHGTNLAEMPYIATLEKFRNQGMCRRLMTAIDSVLSYLQVDKLIIPSARQTVRSWTNGYGFRPLDANIEQHIKVYQPLMFFKTIRLVKTLMPPSIAGPSKPVNQDRQVRVAEKNNDQDGQGSRNKGKAPALLDLNHMPLEQDQN